jgi:hypothetical protein
MAVNYRVPGQRTVYAQPNTMACWATVFAMMSSWKQGVTFPNIRAAIIPLGQPWLGYFDGNTGISATVGTAFERAVGLTREPRSNLSPEGWMSLLQKCGLLWVTGTLTGGGLHDRILEGIAGDGTGPGTQMYIVDPAGGRRYPETLDIFLKGFEGQAAVEPFYQDYQILHF